MLPYHLSRNAHIRVGTGPPSRPKRRKRHALIREAYYMLLSFDFFWLRYMLTDAFLFDAFAEHERHAFFL